MNWDSISAIGEVVGALGVILSLIYLARQIRAQNRESRTAAIHELNEAFRNAITSFQNPDLAEVFSRGKDDFESLPETERLQFISMVQGILRVWEDAYYQSQERRLNDRVWKAMVVQFSGYLSLSGVQRVWEIRKDAYSDDFRQFVDTTRPREYRTK